MTLYYVGIDPGREGAFALLASDGRLVDIRQMPDDRKCSVGHQTATLIEDWRSTYGSLFFTIEKTIVLPIQGACSAHTTGLNAGITIGILTAMEIPFTLVLPRQWSAFWHQGIDGPTTKAKSLVAARRRWPQQEWRRYPKSGKYCDGDIDAALICEWGRLFRWTRKGDELVSQPALTDDSLINRG